MAPGMCRSSTSFGRSGRSGAAIRAIVGSRSPSGSRSPPTHDGRRRGAPRFPRGRACRRPHQLLPGRTQEGLQHGQGDRAEEPGRPTAHAREVRRLHRSFEVAAPGRQTDPMEPAVAGARGRLLLPLRSCARPRLVPLSPRIETAFWLFPTDGRCLLRVTLGVGPRRVLHRVLIRATGARRSLHDTRTLSFGPIGNECPCPRHGRERGLRAGVNCL